MSSKPKKKFSLKSLRFHSKDHSTGSTESVSTSESSALARPMPELVEPPQSERAALVTPTQPAGSQVEIALSRDGAAASLASRSPPSAFRMPTPASSGMALNVHLPSPSMPLDTRNVQMPEPVQLPTPLAANPPDDTTAQDPEATQFPEPAPSARIDGAPPPVTATRRVDGSDVLAELAAVALKVESGDPLSRRKDAVSRALDGTGTL